MGLETFKRLISETRPGLSEEELRRLYRNASDDEDLKKAFGEAINAELAQFIAKREMRDRLETEVARGLSHHKVGKELLSIDSREVMRRLPPDAALIDIVRYTSINCKAVIGKGDPLQGGERYLAFVVDGSRPQSVRMVDLGKAGSIDRMILNCR
jgi:hypothetical protein